MRAARYYGIEDIRVEEIDEPIVKDGHVKIKPAFVGICGTGEQFPMSLIFRNTDPCPAP
jgi:D-arabinose 1-dehydrogenase-like Zn-dependent alcohol dehydrogenase